MHPSMEDAMSRSVERSACLLFRISGLAKIRGAAKTHFRVADPGVEGITLRFAVRLGLAPPERGVEHG